MKASNPSSSSLAQEERQNGGILVVLPEPSQDDPLVDKKKAILSERRVNLVFLLHDEIFVSEKLEEGMLLEQMIRAARILHLNETEWYFMEDDDFGPFSPRNELESLYFIYCITRDLLHSISGEKIEILQALQNAIINKIECLVNDDSENVGGVTCTGQVERQLLDWAMKQGVNSKLNIGDFKGYGRGAIADTDLNVGDIAMEIPKTLIISEETVIRSDMGKVLENIDELASETITLLWSMRERHNLNSDFKQYFESLPKHFNTGLSFGIQALAALEGTLLLEEIVQAKEHLRVQYEKLWSTILAKTPEIFPPEFYTWDQFLWACELWYSNSMKISFPDNKLKTCLVPVASLLNHSLYPHVMHYSKVDPKTDTLKLYVSRPCKSGQQCYLSYGPLCSSHLVTFYGFLLRGDNPYDTIPIDLELPEKVEPHDQSPDDGCPFSHMVRGTWLSKSKQNNYGLPSRLLSVLRFALFDENELGLQLENLRHCITSKDNEAAVLEALLAILQPMLDLMGQPDEVSSEDCEGDVNLAVQFKGGQQRILSSICESCISGLQDLDSS